MHTLGATVGGVAQKPGLHDGAIEIREYLSLTISSDHDVVDSAPAARFVKSFRERIEGASALEERPGSVPTRAREEAADLESR
jgi:pyruvate/2-oxoglutarate dehydrogenase complex dihydrolipoamide acyltransferase (E2) component